MKRLKGLTASALILFVVIPSALWAGTTGKIAGTITDKSTGERLPGASIVVVGTTLGASSNLDGHYTILEVPPGTYKVQISYVGYRTTIVEDVHVNIDQTARVDVALESEAIRAGEVVVTAQTRLIKPDVATSVVAISANQVQELPAMSVMNALGLQAGVRGGWGSALGYAARPSFLSTYYSNATYERGNVQVGGGLTIRGGGGDQILVNVDGATLRDPRNNEPDTRIALSDVKEISIERGGFNAEYGQVSAGVVNIVTREGSKDYYSGRFQMRVAPPQTKYWLAPGITDVNNPMSYVLRPFFDPAVCWTGTTNGAWDYYTQKKYPVFEGWDAISQQLNANGYNLTPAGAQRAFEYEIRKQQPNNQPDYNIDAGLGGPVPFVSSMLGDLRFFASYRSNRSMLVWPLSRPDYRDYDGTLQLISNITPMLKLQLNGLYGETFTERQNWDGLGGYFYPQTASDVVGQIRGIYSSIGLFTMYSDFNFSLTDIWHRSLSAKLTHTISPDTYYEILVQNYTVDYNTRPSALRDTSQQIEVVPGYYEDSNPFGYWPYNSTGVLVYGSQNIAKARDHSIVGTTSIKADITSQVNFQNMVKAGLSFDYNDLNFDYGIIQSQTFGQAYSSRTQLHVYPYRGAAYIQDKLETKEFTMNAGLRLDYSDANVHWWDVNPFEALFFSTTYDTAKVFPTSPAKMQLDLSPRLGISHPISENAKLFFNYGWFRELPQYETIFRVGRNQLNAMQSYGNPNLVLAKTVSYELGMDFSIGDEYLLQAAGYYNDISDQQDVIHYLATAAGFDYYATSANNYADNRGFELTFRKTSGNWVNGFINYTYQVNTTGHFGESNIYDNVSDQKNFNAATINLYQNRPIPQPFARANLNFFTPDDFGPELIGNHILGAIMLNVVLDWQAGYWTTWNPNGILNIAYNVQAVDYFNTYLRLQKTLNFGKLNFQLFMDVNNVFNTLRLWGTDDQNYLASLHLPKSDAYPNIPGSDKVGDYRKPGVDWQPMERQSSIDQRTPTPPADHARAIYYATTTGKYWWYRDGAWSLVPQSKIDQVLADKAYINMPNESTFWFLDPRTFFFGLTVSFNLSD